MAMFRKIEFLPDKFEQRVKPFTSTVSDVKLETNDNGVTYIIIEFGEEEAPLKINLGFPDKWVDSNGGQVPKPGSVIYKFLKSLSYLGIDPLINDDLTEIKFEPSIIGKECSFDVVSKTFNSQTDVDEEGNPKVITFYTWTLTKVVDPVLKSQQQAKSASSKPITTPIANTPVIATTPVETEVAAVNAATIDIEKIKKTWITIISNISDDKFGFPMLIKTKGMFLSGKQVDDLERTYYTNIDNVKKIISELEAEGYISKTGTEYVKNNDAIFLALA